MDQLLRQFYKLLMVLAGVSMVSAFCTVMLSVVAREMAWEISGLDAYAGYAIAAALFLALPGTLQHGDHIRVTLLFDRASPAVRSVLQWWCLLAGTALSLYIAWFSLRLVWISWTTHDVSASSDASPLWIPQIAMALGCIGFALAFIQALVTHARGGSFIEIADGAAHVE